MTSCDHVKGAFLVSIFPDFSQISASFGASQVSFTDYDLDEEHFAGVLTYDPPQATSVAPGTEGGGLGIGFDLRKRWMSL